MDDSAAGRPITVLEAIERVDADRFPAGAPIVFPDGIEAPADRPSTNFFDPAETAEPPHIELRRCLGVVEHDPEASWFSRARAWLLIAATGNQRERFELGGRIAYVDHRVGVLIAPADLEKFHTDLTSVPRLFTWLVAKTGIHLPAALLHDGLVHRDREPQSYIAAHPIDREEADRVFRDAMGDLGTPLLRRWLIWTTVMLATLTDSSQRVRWIITISLTLLVVLTLGVLATIDLVDHSAPLPWMADRPWFVELVFGGLFAVLIPAALSISWGSKWLVGVITSVAVAFLFHVTALIVVVLSGFGVLEGLGERAWRKVVTYLAAIAGLVVAGVGVAGVIRVFS